MRNNAVKSMKTSDVSEKNVNGVNTVNDGDIDNNGKNVHSESDSNSNSIGNNEHSSGSGSKRGLLEPNQIKRVIFCSGKVRTVLYLSVCYSSSLSHSQCLSLSLSLTFTPSLYLSLAQTHTPSLSLSHTPPPLHHTHPGFLSLISRQSCPQYRRHNLSEGRTSSSLPLRFIGTSYTKIP